jgi:hypothetical protein
MVRKTVCIPAEEYKRLRKVDALADDMVRQLRATDPDFLAERLKRLGVSKIWQ